MKKNNNKKKMLVIVLLLVVMLGVVGYGAYSYYYTIGTLNTPAATSTGDENVINITGSFNPYVTDEGESSSDRFLGAGGSVTLSCPQTIGPNETFYCESSLTVHNSGSTPISVSYYDFDPNISSDDVTVSIESSSISWDNSNYSYITIEPNDSEHLSIRVQIKVGDSTSVPGDEPILVNEPVTGGGSFSAYANFRLSASQNLND